MKCSYFVLSPQEVVTLNLLLILININIITLSNELAAKYPVRTKIFDVTKYMRRDYVILVFLDI